MSKTTQKNTSRSTACRLVLVTTLLTTVMLLALFTLYVQTQPKAELSGVSQPTFLYVQTAHSGTLSPELADGRRTLTLNDVSPSTTYFSDRPDRITGHESTEAFIAEWNDGKDSFASNPPNAALDILDEDSQRIAILELMDAMYDATANTLEYEVVVLDDETGGDLPQEFGEAALLIDDAWKHYHCHCTPAPGEKSCDCKYNYTLGKSSTREFKGFCGGGLYISAINVSGRNRSTTCTDDVIWMGYISRSCTNWSPLTRDDLHVTVRCDQH